MKVRNKTLHHLGFLFLIFIISTYCSLIPNDRVITNDPEDFDLLEGITYNIVHSMSEKNLGSIGEKVQVGTPNETDLYQHWSLRKVGDNIYNIVNVGLGRNLDNNGKGVYVSSPEHDSILNPYQHWTFTKIKNYTYNIANVRTESRSLDSIDSDGALVYIKISDKNNRYQQWIFEPINYKLITKLIDVDLNSEKEDIKKNQINLLSTNDTFENPSNVTLERVFEKKETRQNSYTLEIRKSDSFKLDAYIEMFFEIGTYIFDELPVKAGIKGGIKGEFIATNEESYKGTVKDEVLYRIQQHVSVNPYTSVEVIANTDKYDIIVPFKGKIRISCKADRLGRSGKVIKMTDVDANAIKYYVQRENAGITIMKENFFYIVTNGTLKVSGYGYNSLTQVKTLGSRPQDTSSPKMSDFSPTVSEPSPKNTELSSKVSESSPKNLVIFYHIILILLRIIILQV
ncbi:hypothetical protein RclHR1_04800009 [Rhizophagus clarus]|uniref:Fungal-specific transcription factor domain-containing protein n=1 Tax=Rhizophagus clarus TaxID=94130 RepID=A0A2Z6SD84_9GLOM|nr:hypothetical protein RclHR1_04800009 [Rhizophagus clarus]GES83221.1 fungal-specific transcription factor domain-containing protein [Rhizophagus clarus]